MTNLTHLDETGAAHMVDVSGKAITAREAVATGRIDMSPDAASAIDRRGADAPAGCRGGDTGTGRLSPFRHARPPAAVASIEIGDT